MMGAMSPFWPDWPGISTTATAVGGVRSGRYVEQSEAESEKPNNGDGDPASSEGVK